jgi:hypothetical protein
VTRDKLAELGLQTMATSLAIRRCCARGSLVAGRPYRPSAATTRARVSEHEPVTISHEETFDHDIASRDQITGFAVTVRPSRPGCVGRRLRATISIKINFATSV